MFNPFLLQSATDVATLVALVCAVAYVAIARSMPSQRYYYWFALATCMQCVNWWSLGEAPAPSLYLQNAHLAWHWLGIVVLLAFGSGVLAHIRLEPSLARWFQRAFLLWLVALAGVLTGLVSSGHQVPRTWAYFGAYVPYIGFAALMFWASKREPGVGLFAIGLALLSLPIAALYLALTQNQVLLMRQVAMGPILVMMIAMLPAAQVRHRRRLRQEVRERLRAERELKASNASLAQRVADRTKDVEQALQAAQSADQAKSRFLAVVSHEIRTPLSGLTGMLDLLAEERLSPDQNDLVATARASSQQLRRLLDNVIDLSKVEAGMLAISPTPFSIGAECRASVQSFVSSARAKGIDLQLECPQIAPWIRSDPVKFRQILDNLINNAVKFTREGSVTVSVSTRSDPDMACRLWVCAEVSDTGPGVPEHERDAIFQPFVQAQSMSIEHREYSGSGLGLTLARQLARALGGDLNFSPSPSGGSLFRLMVPGERVESDTIQVARADALAGRLETGDAGTPWLVGRRILVTDDNVLIRKVLDRMLTRLGAEVTLADSGAVSVSLANEVAFDLILMDVSMPDVNGLEATRAIRQRRPGGEGAPTGTSPDVPILGISAHVLAGDREECLVAGMSEYLTKPIDREALLAAMCRQLGPCRSATTL